MDELIGLDWFERLYWIEHDAVGVLADNLRHKWLARGGDDRPWPEWEEAVLREYSPCELADMRVKVAAACYPPQSTGTSTDTQSL